MALDLVFFDKTPVTVLKIRKPGRFLARLLTIDVSRLAVGEVKRAVMMNATGGIIGLPWVARVENDAYELFLTGEEADAEQAWVRQVSVAFDAEVESETLVGLPFVGTMPVDGINLSENGYVCASGIRFMNLGWISLVVGKEENIASLHDNLIAAGAKKGEKSGFDALRIFAREPAMGLEITEGTGPLEAGLTDALDFDDPDRIFIGRALTEARMKAESHMVLHLIAFEVAFDPNLLLEVPYVEWKGTRYPLTSIARIPEGPYTVGLVRLPREVEVGSHVHTEVITDPRSVCEVALVIDPQL